MRLLTGKPRYRSGRLHRSWRLWLAVTMAGIALAEGALRILLDFPLYGADDEVGYYLLPNQHGSYLLRNDWTFNSQGMGTAEDFRSSRKLDVLLVGDSIVLGGNPLAQKDKLGPQLARQTGFKVWPISAGSWALQNELAILKRLPDAVREVDLIVFVLNSDDFGQPSSWSSPITHPRERPTSYLVYLARKSLPLGPASPPPELSVASSPNLPREWQAFVNAAEAPVLVIAYPKQAENGQGCAWMPAWIASTTTVECYTPPEERFKELYRDPIHPTAQGNELLASFIGQSIEAR